MMTVIWGLSSNSTCHLWHDLNLRQQYLHCIRRRKCHFEERSPGSTSRSLLRFRSLPFQLNSGENGANVAYVGYDTTIVQNFTKLHLCQKNLNENSSTLNIKWIPFSPEPLISPAWLLLNEWPFMRYLFIGRSVYNWMIIAFTGESVWLRIQMHSFFCYFNHFFNTNNFTFFT